MSRVFDVWRKPEETPESAPAPVGEDPEIERAIALIAEGLMAVVRLTRRRDSTEMTELSAAVRMLQQAMEATVGGVLELRERLDRLAVLVESQQASYGAVREQQQVQQEEVTGIQQSVAALSGRVGDLAERVDRQAEAFQATCEIQSQRETAFQQLGEALLSLRQAAAAARCLSKAAL